MTALQWIVKEAKSIKKQYPKRFAKWTDYVAQASAIYASKHKGKSPVGKKKAAKKTAKKKVSGVKDSKAVKTALAKKGLKMPHGYQTIKRKRKIGAVSKKATTMHKDTASHNVKISVMSGVVKPKPIIEKLAKKIEKLTDYNDHNNSVLTLAKFLKEKRAVELMNYIIKMHKNYGHMPQQLIQLRSNILSQLLEKFKHKYGLVEFNLINRAF